MKVLFAAMLIDAVHAAFENRIVAFDRIRIDLDSGLTISVAVFVASMVHHVVFREVVAEMTIAAGFVGHQMGFAIKICVNDRNDGFLGTLSTWNERAEPPRSTSERTAFLCQGLACPQHPSLRPMNVSSTSMIDPSPPIGAKTATRMASRMRCIMNHVDL